MGFDNSQVLGKTLSSLLDSSIGGMTTVVPSESTIREYLINVFGKYKKLLSRFGINQHTISDVDLLCEAILRAHQLYLDENIPEAYQVFSDAMKVCPIPTTTLHKDMKLYRARTELQTNSKEFYHVPFNQRFLCSNNRFSIAGYPCLYLGCSPEICLCEIKNQKSSCIEIQLKDNLNVADLTLNVLSFDSLLQRDDPMQLLNIFPLLVSCYLIYQPGDWDKIKFREEYIIPQLLTMYIRNEMKNVDGIRYFTAQIEYLFSNDDQYKNVVLFTNCRDNQIYDQQLINKFVWRDESIKTYNTSDKK